MHDDAVDCKIYNRTKSLPMNIKVATKSRSMLIDFALILDRHNCEMHIEFGA